MSKKQVVDSWLPEFDRWEDHYKWLRDPRKTESALIPVDDLPILYLAMHNFSGWNYAGMSIYKDAKALRAYIYDQMTEAQQFWCDDVIERFRDYTTELQGEPE